MMVAKTIQAQTHCAQLRTHAASREYLALVPEVKAQTVEGAIGRHGKDRTKMAIVVMRQKP